MAQRTWVIDIDDTIMRCQRKECLSCGRTMYGPPSPNTRLIAKINERYQAGDVIILHTARGWHLYKFTVNQLRSVGIRYNELIMGKPQGTYVDADAVKEIL